MTLIGNPILFFVAVTLSAALASAESGMIKFRSEVWLIESEADSISPAIELWAWSDVDLGGMSLPFEVRFDYSDFDGDRLKTDSRRTGTSISSPHRSIRTYMLIRSSTIQESPLQSQRSAEVFSTR